MGERVGCGWSVGALVVPGRGGAGGQPATHGSIHRYDVRRAPCDLRPDTPMPARPPPPLRSGYVSMLSWCLFIPPSRSPSSASLAYFKLFYLLPRLSIKKNITT
eukprot:scaffold22852_cov88-Isochrysis_galbana.AAC.1